MKRRPSLDDFEAEMRRRRASPPRDVFELPAGDAADELLRALDRSAARRKRQRGARS